MTRLVILGAGGHGRVVADCASATGKYQDIVFLDDCLPQRSQNAHWSIVDTPDNWQKYRAQSEFVVAFGQNALRKKYTQEIANEDGQLATIIHPSAVISNQVNIGKGSVIFANVTVNFGVTIGDGCILNTACSIDHDCHVHDYVHISPQVAIAGGVTIETMSWLGINSTVIECLTLASGTQTGAGAVIVNDTQPNTLYLGVPAAAHKTIPSA
ncbi:acetyltransferase [Thalassotalea fusca]